MNVETRTLDKADIARSFDIRTRAFGALPDAARPGWEAEVARAIEERRVVAAYDGDLLVARALIRPFAQFWGGRVLPMAGIAGVIVSPEYRGRGVGTALMSAVVERGRELGCPLSVLYPATVQVYRKTGWEIAGTQPRITITTRILRELRGGEVEVRQAGPGDGTRLTAIMREQYAADRANGARDCLAEEFAEELADPSVFAYVADDGFVLYGWDDKDLVVYQLMAGTRETARALWAVVGSSSSVAERVHAYVSPDDPIHQLLGECVAEEVKETRWMLRLLDVEAALAGRGYPSGVQLDVPLVIDDPQAAANTVSGRLTVSGGSGQLVLDDAVTADDAVRLGPNGLAALYAGTPMASLVVAGLVQGGSAEHHALLDAAYVGRRAYLLDYF